MFIILISGLIIGLTVAIIRYRRIRKEAILLQHSHLDYLNHLAFKSEIIMAAKEYAKEYMNNYDSSHDFLHVERVLLNTMKIMSHQEDFKKMDHEFIMLSALLHDIGDHKYTKSGQTETHQVESFLISNRYDVKKTRELLAILAGMSWTEQEEKEKKRIIEDPSLELRILRDADRLDAIGAHGILRTAGYNTTRNNPLVLRDGKKCCTKFIHDHMIKKLSERMYTDVAKAEAKIRQKVMSRFLKNIHQEQLFA